MVSTRSSSFNVIDVHHHVGTLRAVPQQPATLSTSLGDDCSHRIEMLDKYGIEGAVLMPAFGPGAGISVEECRCANDEVARVRNAEPSRFPAAIGSVGYLQGEDALSEIDRCVLELGMRGVAWHHRFQGVPVDHPTMWPLLGRLAQYALPAFIHVIAESTMESPWRLEKLADAFPEITFVALDAFSSPHQAHWMQYIATKHQNILFDTGVLTAVAHGLETFIAEIGPQRLLFGSDFYSAPTLFRVPYALFEIVESQIGDFAKGQILGANARALLHIQA